MKREELESLIRGIVSDQFAKQVREAQETSSATAKRLQDAASGPEGSGPMGAGTAVIAPQKGGEMLSMIVRAWAAGRGDPGRAAAHAIKHWGDDGLAVSKALAAGEGSAGGFIVPPGISQEIIEFLRPLSVIRALGPVMIPMPQGSIRIPKQTGGIAASYIGENANLPNSQPTFGQIALTYKKLAALVPISNDLLRYSAPGINGIVRTDLVRAMAQRESQAFLSDSGTDSTPKGLRHWANASNVAASAGAWSTLANIVTDLGAMILALRMANIPMSKPAWIMNPVEWNRLMTIQNTNGFFVFREEMMSGRLWGYPFGVTTQVAGSVGGSDSDLYLADFDDVAIGEAASLIVDSSTEAAYHDGSSVVASFSLDQTVVRAIQEHDFAVRRDLAVAVRTGIAA